MAGIKKEVLIAAENKNKILTIAVIILAVLLICGAIAAIFIATNSKVKENDWTPNTSISFSTDGENWFTDKRQFDVDKVVYMKIIIETKIHKLIKGKPEWHECALIIPSSTDVVGKLVSANGSDKYQPLGKTGKGYTLKFQVPNDEVDISAKTYLVKFTPIEEGINKKIWIRYDDGSNEEDNRNRWTYIDFIKFESKN